MSDKPRIALTPKVGPTLQRTGVALAPGAKKIMLGTVAAVINAAEEKPPQNLEELEAHDAEHLAFVSEALLDYRAKARKEVERFANAVATNYWCCLVFQSQPAKQEFLQRVGIDIAQRGDVYISGEELARVLGMPLTTPIPPDAPKPRFNRRLIELVVEEVSDDEEIDDDLLTDDDLDDGDDDDPDS